MDPTVTVTNSSVTLSDLELRRPEVMSFFAALPEGERAQVALQAVEVGTFCLERARSGRDLDFVRHEVDRLLAAVERALGAVPQAVEEALLARIGTSDGQVLAPIEALVRQSEQAQLGRIQDVRALLEAEIDPSKQTTTLGRALKTIGELLDPVRKDSVPGRIETALEQIVGSDGTLAKTVSSAIQASVKGLADEVAQLRHLVDREAAVSDALLQGTGKGRPFEECALERITSWGGLNGAEVEHCGGDNQPGDLLVTVCADGPTGLALTIVVECRDQATPAGRKPITAQMQKALVERGASRGIYLSKSGTGLAKELGEWGEGRCGAGSWVATSETHLLTALRFLLVSERLEQMKASRPEVDAEAILAQVERVRTALRRIATVNGRVTEITGAATSIKVEADALRGDVADALASIEEALKAPVGAATDEAA